VSINAEAKGVFLNVFRFSFFLPGLLFSGKSGDIVFDGLVGWSISINFRFPGVDKPNLLNHFSKAEYRYMA
jgi:hypothetical protein